MELVSPELVLVAPPELRRLALQSLDVFVPPRVEHRAAAVAARRFTFGAAVFVTLLCANGIAPLFLIFALHR